MDDATWGNHQQKTISHESFDLAAMTMPRWSRDRGIFSPTIEVAAIQTTTRETQVLTLRTLLGRRTEIPSPTRRRSSGGERACGLAWRSEGKEFQKKKSGGKCCGIFLRSKYVRVPFHSSQSEKEVTRKRHAHGVLKRLKKKGQEETPRTRCCYKTKGHAHTREVYKKNGNKTLRGVKYSTS